MLTTVSQLNEIFRIGWNLYVTDFLDILIIALLLYSIFIFLRKTRATMVVLGLTITLFLYLLAKTFNLYLTFITLRYFVGVSVVIFVVIFQTEIKRYFEFLGIAGSRHIKVGPIMERKSPVMFEIIQACVKMAQSKIGALIVIQAKDGISEFIDGGTPLDGIISEDVLLSIFDPHSEGHDGALIIKNNRISVFGAHLPLSTNFKEIGKHGTRHSAALGLSEVTDALCIVVSEQRGEISVCKDGKMKILTQFSDLEKELDKFIKSKFETTKTNNFIAFIKHDPWLKLSAIVLSTLVWFFTAYQAGVIEKQYNIPITIDKLPKDIIIDSYSPKEIVLTVSGRGESVFSNISQEDFKVLFDASNIQEVTGKQPITRKGITVPSNLSLVKFEPEEFLLTSQRYYSVKVRVTAKVSEEIPENIEIKSVEVTPEEVELWIPIESEPPAEVSTEVLGVKSTAETIIEPVELVLPEGLKLVNDEFTVNVALTTQEKEQE